jgi:hypothetical protein
LPATARWLLVAEPVASGQLLVTVLLVADDNETCKELGDPATWIKWLPSGCAKQVDLTTQNRGKIWLQKFGIKSPPKDGFAVANDLLKKGRHEKYSLTPESAALLLSDKLGTHTGNSKATRRRLKPFSIDRS